MKYIHLNATHSSGKETSCSVGPFATAEGMIEWGGWLDELVGEARDEGHNVSASWKMEMEPLERNYDSLRSPGSILEIEQNR